MSKSPVNVAKRQLDQINKRMDELENQRADIDTEMEILRARRVEVNSFLRSTEEFSTEMTLEELIKKEKEEAAKETRRGPKTNNPTPEVLLEAVRKSLKQANEALALDQIYDDVTENQGFSFESKDPRAYLRSKLYGFAKKGDLQNNNGKFWVPLSEQSSNEENTVDESEQVTEGSEGQAETQPAEETQSV